MIVEQCSTLKHAKQDTKSKKANGAELWSPTNSNSHKTKAQNLNSFLFLQYLCKKKYYTCWVGFPALTGYFCNFSLVEEDPILLVVITNYLALWHHFLYYREYCTSIWKLTKTLYRENTGDQITVVTKQNSDP